ncbi:MAG: hypothetical protein O3A10_10135 [Chloroflexi bacterium]|nr:hypothetical protein [Chloroflexota bacterium]MDA1146512.1 hypothetical protein [Chloroflexota bacterium]
MNERTPSADMAPTVSAAIARALARRVLARCAVCEQDQALVPSHQDADRVLLSHLNDCPGPMLIP